VAPNTSRTKICGFVAHKFSLAVHWDFILALFGGGNDHCPCKRQSQMTIAIVTKTAQQINPATTVLRTPRAMAMSSNSGSSPMTAILRTICRKAKDPAGGGGVFHDDGPWASESQLCEQRDAILFHKTRQNSRPNMLRVKLFSRLLWWKFLAFYLKNVL
jgi:hypothetical protein